MPRRSTRESLLIAATALAGMATPAMAMYKESKNRARIKDLKAQRTLLNYENDRLQKLVGDLEKSTDQGGVIATIQRIVQHTIPTDVVARTFVSLLVLGSDARKLLWRRYMFALRDAGRMLLKSRKRDQYKKINVYALVIAAPYLVKYLPKMTGERLKEMFSELTVREVRIPPGAPAEWREIEGPGTVKSEIVLVPQKIGIWSKIMYLLTTNTSNVTKTQAIIYFHEFVHFLQAATFCQVNRNDNGREQHATTFTTDVAAEVGMDDANQRGWKAMLRVIPVFFPELDSLKEYYGAGMNVEKSYKSATMQAFMNNCPPPQGISQAEFLAMMKKVAMEKGTIPPSDIA